MILKRVLLQTSSGDITVALNTEEAPETTENFLAYVKDGFYDNTIFHRIIAGFMIQGGGFSPGMVQKSTHSPIKNEADNGLKNMKGTLAMARTSDPHSASSQFFINVANNDFLNFQSKTSNGWGYCVFGEVSDGIDIVEALSKVSTTSRAGHQDIPEEDVVIQTATVV